MFSKILLSKNNLLHNLNFLKKIKKDKKICVIVKAEAYGHGSAEIVSILKDEVEYFGVSNQSEAEKLRKIINNDIIVFGVCDDYLTCIQQNISFALFSYKQLKKILKLVNNEISLIPKMHLCINSGMNRYGIKTLNEFKKVINLLKRKNLQLEGIYTHFSSLTTDLNYTQRQKETFYRFLSYLPNNWNTIKHVGGGRSIFTDINADMYRVGIECYGYGNEELKPVMQIYSKIVDIQEVAKGEHIGYLCGYTAKENIRIATIPLGYGDGLPRKLSNKLEVEINGKKALNVGNICMDAFMVDISNISCKIGDNVLIMKDAVKLSQIINTSEYEVLTNFNRFRGERIIY